MKFLIDMPVTPAAVAFLAARGHHAVHAFTVGLSAASDSEILTVARREGRVVITADLDYPRLLAAHQSAGPGLIRRGLVDAVVVGCDRVAANGDVANKVGTYPLALAAREAGIPFVVAGPTSSIDAALAHGDGIEIEERHADEVRLIGGAAVTVAGTVVRNPAFDVTPAALVTALVTERGTARPVDGAALAGLLA